MIPTVRVEPRGQAGSGVRFGVPLLALTMALIFGGVLAVVVVFVFVVRAVCVRDVFVAERFEMSNERFPHFVFVDDHAAFRRQVRAWGLAIVFLVGGCDSATQSARQRHRKQRKNRYATVQKHRKIIASDHTHFGAG